MVYSGDMSGMVYVLDKDTGETVWDSDVPNGPINCHPTVVDGVMYIGDRVGHLHAFDAESGEHLWKYRTGNAVQSTPVVTDDTIYFGSNDGHVYAIEREH